MLTFFSAVFKALRGALRATPFYGDKQVDYLTELQRHAADLAARPENWMPWNDRQTIQETSADTPG